MPTLVKIADGKRHGRGDLPASVKHGGDLYIANDDETRDFADKFVPLDRSQAVSAIKALKIDEVIDLVGGTAEKAQYLLPLEREGKQRTTLIDRLILIMPQEQE